MPLDQTRRHNPLMLGYASEIGLSDEALSRKAGVAYSQVYMARTRHVGANNAAKIARAVTLILGLSEADEMELKAEIMGDPGNLVHAYLGNGHEIAKSLDEEPRIGMALVGGRPLAYKSGNRVIKKLEAMKAPLEVLDTVRRNMKPPPSPPGRITYTLSGDPLRRQRDSAWDRFEEAKPSTYAAIKASGLSRKDIYERAGIGRETLRQALYKSCGAKAAATISKLLAEYADLSREEQEAVRGELLTTTEKLLEKSQKKLS